MKNSWNLIQWPAGPRNFDLMPALVCKAILCVWAYLHLLSKWQIPVSRMFRHCIGMSPLDLPEAPGARGTPGLLVPNLEKTLGRCLGGNCWDCWWYPWSSLRSEDLERRVEDEEETVIFLLDDIFSDKIFSWTNSEKVALNKDWIDLVQT